MPLFTEKQFIVVSAKSPFLRGETPKSVADLGQVPFVTMLMSDIFFKDPTFLFCLDAGFTPQINLRTDNYMVKLCHIREGKGAAVLPESCLETAGMIIPDMLTIPVEKEGKACCRTVSLMHRKEAYMTETALASGAENLYNILQKPWHKRMEKRSFDLKILKGLCLLSIALTPLVIGEFLIFQVCVQKSDGDNQWGGRV